MAKYIVNNSTTNPVKIGAKIDLQSITIHGDPKDRNKKKIKKSRQKTTRQLLQEFIVEVRGVFKRNDLH